MPPAPPARGSPYPSASSTSVRKSASCSGNSTSDSACHCTPMNMPSLSSSIASTTPSGDHATARRPLPQRSAAWWWNELTWASITPITRASREFGVDPHPVGRHAPARRLAVLDRPVGEVAEVLVQRAAARDVERLAAAADPQHRHPARVGELGERELVGVEVGLGRPELRVARRLAVAVRVDVRAARQADPAQAVQQRRDRVVAERRQHDRQAAGELDRAHVDHPERHLALRRIALGHRVGLLREPHLRGGHADQRPAHPGSTHVSFAPPFWDELTTSAPSSKATRVSPPGATRASSSRPRKT